MATGVFIPKLRSPLEQAIAESKDRRVSYERRMREQGFKKCTFWVPVDCTDDVKQLVKLLGATNGGYRSALKLLIAGKPIDAEQSK